jgi:UTP:GlnB (protein PII) uridylyltransferase
MTEFLRTMPAAYAREFAPSEIADHERVVARRGERLVHAEICATSSGELVCVVAEDRPGLLVLVTDALLVHGLSIHSAKVFCRRRASGQFEAVDFFQLRHAAGDASIAVGVAELGAFLQTLSELVAEDLIAASRQSTPPPSNSPNLRVYFELGAQGRDEAVLRVEAPDSEGLLNAITNALAAQDAHIRASEIRTESGIARDRFDLSSKDGQTFTAVRLCDIQQSVYVALQKLVRRRA